MKPRIYYENGLWYCCCMSFTGYGSNVKSSYLRWFYKLNDWNIDINKSIECIK